MNKRQRKKWLKRQGLYINPKETWSLDYTIAKFVLPRLEYFKRVNNGYPGRDEMDTPEKWDAALDKMINSFRIIVSSGCDFAYGLDRDDYLDRQSYLEAIDAKTTEIQEGLMLFAKWYQHLWW